MDVKRERESARLRETEEGRRKVFSEDVVRRCRGGSLAQSPQRNKKAYFTVLYKGQVDGVLKIWLVLNF